MELNWMRLGNLGCVRTFCYFQCKHKNECRDRWINVNMVLSMCVLSRLCMVNCRKIINDSKAFCTVLVAHMRLLSRPVKPQKKKYNRVNIFTNKIDTQRENINIRLNSIIQPYSYLHRYRHHRRYSYQKIQWIESNNNNNNEKKNRRKIANCIFIRVIVVAYANGAS